jgi:hypothetical protein
LLFNLALGYVIFIRKVQEDQVGLISVGTNVLLVCADAVNLLDTKDATKKRQNL